MQIVRDLAGYSWGRSDLVRRAMSKKKASVMEKERKNFIYGNPDENVPGCVNNGIDEKIAGKIYDEMIVLQNTPLTNPCGVLCGGILSDSLFKDALSGRIYGGADDFRSR